MRSILAILVVNVLVGCANTEVWRVENRYGYRPEDPCIRCGEKWDTLHRHPLQAQCENGQPWRCQ